MKVISLRKIIRVISAWEEGKIIFRVGGEEEGSPQCIWFQIICDRVSILQIELDLTKLITYTPPKEETIFSLDAKTLINVMKFADLDGTVKIGYDDGKVRFEFTVEDKSKSVEIYLRENKHDSDCFLMDKEYTTSVSLLTQEFKQIVENLLLFDDEMYIGFNNKNQIKFSVVNDTTDISVILNESSAKPSALKLKCGSGKLVSAKNSNYQKAREFKISENYRISVKIKYIQRIIQVIDNLKYKPLYIKSKIFNETYPWSLEFIIPNVATIKYFICLLLEEKEE